MAENCPTCGSEVRVVSGDEGTSHYEPSEAALFPNMGAQLAIEAAEARCKELEEALTVISEAHYDPAGLREIARLTLEIQTYRAEGRTALKGGEADAR